MGAWRRRAAEEDGLSLMELVVAFTILLVIMSGTAAAVTGALNLTRLNRNRVVAANIATEQLERERTRAFDLLAAGAAENQTVTVNGVDYTVAITRRWAAPGATTDVCDPRTAVSGDLAYLQVGVEVTWANMGSVPPVRSETLITPPAGDYSPYSGHIVSRVRDRTGALVSGVDVTLAGGPSSRAPDTTDPCAVFAALSPGAYTVSIARSGWISSVFTAGNFVASPSLSRTVSVGNTIAADFDFDQAGTLDLRLTGPAGGTPPVSLPVTIANPRIPPAPDGISTRTVTGTAVTIPVFPYADGFQVWAGTASCAAHRPSPPAVLEPEPGQTVSRNLLATLQVNLRDLVNRPVRNAPGTIRATSQTCAGVTYAVAATSNGSGQVTVALPYGRYSITIDASLAAAQTVTLGTASTAYSTTMTLPILAP